MGESSLHTPQNYVHQAIAVGHIYTEGKWRKPYRGKEKRVAVVVAAAVAAARRYALAKLNFSPLSHPVCGCDPTSLLAGVRATSPHAHTLSPSLAHTHQRVEVAPLFSV